MNPVRTRRDGILVTGRDAASYLHSQLSQDVASLGIGEARPALALDPGGRVIALCRVVRLDESRWLVDVDRGYRDVLIARLARFRIRVDVEFEPVTVACTSWREVDRAPVADGLVVPAWWGDGTSFDRLTIDELTVDDEANSHDGRPDDESDLEASRIRAVWPRMGHEIVPGETLPAATGVVRVAVDFGKGCYPGQELVERMDSRGATAPLVLRRIDAPGDLRPGDDVVVDGRVVGTVTSVAGGAALAYLKRAEAD